MTTFTFSNLEMRLLQEQLQLTQEEFLSQVNESLAANANQQVSGVLWGNCVTCNPFLFFSSKKVCIWTWRR